MAARGSTRTTKSSKRKLDSEDASSNLESGIDVNSANENTVRQLLRRRTKETGRDEKLVTNGICWDNLGVLSKIPLDVLYEIFKQLCPVGLIKLARTSRSLRGVLLDPDAQGVWKQAQHNISLPICPEGVNVRTYLCLVVERHCHRCLSESAHTCWEFGIRLCLKCIKADSRFLLNTKRNGVVLEYCPTVKVSGYVNGVGSYSYQFYDRKYLDKHYRAYNTMNDAQKVKWTLKEGERARSFREYTSACIQWHEDRKQKEIRASYERRNSRLEEITRRLRDMGWSEVIDNLPDNLRLKIQPGVDNEKKLSEPEWEEMKPRLVKHLAKSKNIAAKLKLEARVNSRTPLLIKYHKEYVNTKPINTIIPPVTAFFDFQPIRDLLLSAEGSVTIDDMARVFEQNDIDSFCAQWRKDMDLVFLRMVTGESDTRNAETTLRKATVAFHCEFCNSAITYPRILAHSHMNFVTKFDASNWPPAEHVESAIRRLEYYYCERSSRIRLKTNYALAAEMVLATCGINPNASTKDVDAIDPFFECTNEACRSSGEVRVMSWRRAIDYVLLHLDKDEDHTLKHVTKESTLVKVRDRRNEALLRDWKKRYICAFCRFQGKGSEMKEHLFVGHGRTHVAKEDFALDMDMDEDKFEYKFPIDFLGIFE